VSGGEAQQSGGIVFASHAVARHTWTPTFAKLSIDDFEEVKIAAIHPDFV